MRSLVTLAVITFLFLSRMTTEADTAADLIKQGDAFSQKLEETEALRCYLPAEKLAPNNVNLLVSIARQYRHSMHDVSTDGEKYKLCQKALEYAQRAVTLAPHDEDAQLSLAITYGKVVPFQGHAEKAESSRRIKEAVDKALQIDPQNDMAWHVLGRWHQKIAGLSGFMKTMAQVAYGMPMASTNEDAVRCFEKAIALNPHRLMHYIELGQTYSQMGRAEEARRYLEKGLSMPSEDKDDPELKVLGRETLAALR